MEISSQRSIIPEATVVTKLFTEEVKDASNELQDTSRYQEDALEEVDISEEALAYAAQKYRHYFQAYTIEVMSKSDGIKCFLQNPALIGRMSRWALMLKGKEEVWEEELKGGVSGVHPCEERDAIWWTLQFDGTPANPCGGAGVVLKRGKGKIFAFSYHLGFPCTNNEQLKGHFGAKEEALAVYREEALRILGLFEEVEALHIPRAKNKHADALATIGSKETRDEGTQVVIFKKKRSPSLTLKPCEEKVKDWRRPILEKLKQKISFKVIREYEELRGILYKRNVEGLLMSCVSETEGIQRENNLHHAMCGEGGPNLYYTMQRVGMHWSSMRAHCKEIQEACERCKDERDCFEVNAIDEDWRVSIREYLEAGILPTEPRKAEKLRKRAEKYFCKDGELYRNSFTGEVLCCMENQQQEAIVI
ncbi:Ribonuclease H superfamily [Sesbania bispinosa]|nr:Ribonuclease H superfamily [Sesbania bispinosa]